MSNSSGGSKGGGFIRFILYLFVLIQAVAVAAIGALTIVGLQFDNNALTEVFNLIGINANASDAGVLLNELFDGRYMTTAGFYAVRMLVMGVALFLTLILARRRVMLFLLSMRLVTDLLDLAVLYQYGGGFDTSTETIALYSVLGGLAVLNLLSILIIGLTGKKNTN